MEIDENDNYTGDIVSESVVGIQKVKALIDYCDNEFGEGN